MRSFTLILTLLLTLSMSACSDWIYRIDVPQGNFLNDRDLEDLRMGMSREQVMFVLGRPMVKDSFDSDTWYYFYKMKRGMKKRGEDHRQSLVVYFENDKVSRVEGDLKLPENFNEPIEQ